MKVYKKGDTIKFKLNSRLWTPHGRLYEGQIYSVEVRETDGAGYVVSFKDQHVWIYNVEVLEEDEEILI